MSEQHRQARREQILDAARQCFARDGFHQTSMQDIFIESGLSAGAVYGHFPSKSAMIAAITQENMHWVVGVLLHGAVDDERPLGHVVADALEAYRSRARDGLMGGIALTVWAEGVRDPEIARHILDGLSEVRSLLIDVVAQRQAVGRLPASFNPAGVTATLLSLVPGYIVQLTLLGEQAVADVPDTVRALLP